MVPKLRVLFRFTLAVSALILSIYYRFHLFHFITLLQLDPRSGLHPFSRVKPGSSNYCNEAFKWNQHCHSPPNAEDACLRVVNGTQLVHDDCSGVTARENVRFSTTGFLIVPENPPLGSMAVSPLNEQWPWDEPALKLSEKPIHHPSPKGWSRLLCNVGEGRIGKDIDIFGEPLLFSVTSTTFSGAITADYKGYVE
jgi:hypothetical protein